MITPHERQDPPTPEPSFPERCRSCFIDFLPLTALILAVAGVVIWLAAGCASPRTSREEVRVACGSAARAYSLAIEQTRAGEMSPATFRAIDDGYQGVIKTCWRVLVGGAEAVPGDLARVETWTVSTAAAP